METWISIGEVARQIAADVARNERGNQCDDDESDDLHSRANHDDERVKQGATGAEKRKAAGVFYPVAHAAASRAMYCRTWSIVLALTSRPFRSWYTKLGSDIAALPNAAALNPVAVK